MTEIVIMPPLTTFPTKPGYVKTGEEMLVNETEKIPMLLSPFFPQVGLVGLVGGSDTGKSSFLREFSMAIASGKLNYLGFPLMSIHESVLYVSTEDDEYAISSLIKKQTDRAESALYKNLRYIFGTEDLEKRVKAELQRQPVDCLIIDAFSDVFAGDLHKSNEVRGFLQQFANLATTYSMLVIFLHHTGKNSEKREPNKNNVLGSQGFEAKMRMLAELRTDPVDKYLRHLIILKGNYIPTEVKEKSFVLEFDENLKFTNTNVRVETSLIVQRDNNRPDMTPAMERAILLHQTGKSLREIADIITREGTSVSKSTIGNWLRQSGSIGLRIVH